MTTTDTDTLTERIAEKIRQALDEGEAMQCTRVWEAWQHGTMTDGDFVDASDGPLAEEITAAVLPIVAVEVRKAKAEALREAANHIEEVVANARPEQAFTEHVLMEHGGPGYLRELATEYETGDSDEHR